MTIRLACESGIVLAFSELGPFQEGNPRAENRVRNIQNDNGGVMEEVYYVNAQQVVFKSFVVD